MTITSILRRGCIFLKENFPRKISATASPNSATSPHICLQKAMNTAASVPQCSKIVNIRPISAENPVKCCTSERCPELETGRNSVSPCTIPWISASHIVICIPLFRRTALHRAPHTQFFIFFRVHSLI